MISKPTLRGILAGTVLILVAAATLGALMPSYGAEAQRPPPKVLCTSLAKLW